MAGGFEFSRRKSGKAPVLYAERGKASTGFKPKDALIFTEGQLDRAVAASKVMGILNSRVARADEMRKPATNPENTTAACEFIQYMHAMGGDAVFKTSLTGEGLEIDSDACSEAGTTTTAKFLSGASAGDFDGGVIYFHDTDTHHAITNDAEAGGTHTVTFSPARDTAPSVATVISILPKGIGSSAIKLSSVEAAQGIDPKIAGASGGHARIEGYNLNPKEFWVEVSFPDVE
ncbi:MAG: hypothetical protein IT440_15400 [Phycisphaeraceae bacterium]|jgi:hypothetical protein|nr:hypothetical protein [Phycisphaeraceae bacterium]